MHTDTDLQRGEKAQSAPAFGEKQKPRPGTQTSYVHTEKHPQEENPASRQVSPLVAAGSLYYEGGMCCGVGEESQKRAVTLAKAT